MSSPFAADKKSPNPATTTTTTTTRTTKATREQKEEVEVQQALDYCGRLLRTLDYENYLCTLHAPSRDARDAFWAIRALNVELARIRDVVSDVRIGRMRFQFWRETIDRLYEGHVAKHPVAVALNEAMARASLSRHWFVRLIDEREKQLSEVPFPSMAAVEQSSENTHSVVLYLLLESLKWKSLPIDHAAGHIGKAQGIATLLRATPFHIGRRKLFLPTDLLAKHKVIEEEVYRGNATSSLVEVVYEVATIAHSHLNTGKQLCLSESMPRDAKLALLSAVPSELYLKRLEKANFNVLDKRLQLRRLSTPLTIWWRAQRRTL